MGMMRKYFIMKNLALNVATHRERKGYIIDVVIIE